MTTAFKGESIGKNLQSCLTSDGGKFDRPAVVDGAGERQHSIIADNDAIRVAHDEIEVEDEIIRREALWLHAIKGNRLALRNRDHRIAIAILREASLNVDEAREIVKSNQIDPIVRDIEAVDRVVAYWLRQRKHVIAARAAQVVVARNCKDRRARSIGFDIIGNHREPGAASRSRSKSAIFATRPHRHSSEVS